MLVFSILTRDCVRLNFTLILLLDVVLWIRIQKSLVIFICHNSKKQVVDLTTLDEGFKCASANGFQIANGGIISHSLIYCGIHLVLNQ